ncbi:MAG TPA: hypothetical protein PK971_14420 [Saprospiraceae bacterium]|nr:hypothetical protein [Saprospiraceae bacterium]
MPRFTLLRTAAVCVLLLAISNCKKADDEAPCTVSSLSVRINGIAWEAEQVVAYAPFGPGGHYSFNATSSSSNQMKSLQFSLPDQISKGPFDLAWVIGVRDYGIVVYPFSGGVQYSASGTLNVTLLDTDAKVMKGNFEFVTYSGDEFSQGAFCMRW